MGRQVAILLATFQGARFLSQQLESLAAQTHPDWVLYWRDDGSRDESAEMVRSFAPERLRPRPGPQRRLGPAGNFLFLLGEAVRDPDNAYFAFCDQDDIWRSDKLERAVRRLEQEPAGECLLYCAGAEIVDENLRSLGFISSPATVPAFPASLTENIAPGCTIVLNRKAAELIARSDPPPEILHDWWSYSLVSGAGGTILTDPEPVVRYRQHGANVIGAPRSPLLRIRRALARGAKGFMTLFRAHVRGLRRNADLLSQAARRDIEAIGGALEDGLPGRLRLLLWRGLRRRRPLETLLFRIWILIG